MLVPFEINPNHPAPLHVKEWIRFQVMKKIDDFRFEILRTLNEDMIGAGLETLKFCFLAEYGRPRFDTFGNLISYDNIVDAFDIPKERFEAEYRAYPVMMCLILGIPVVQDPANNYSTNWMMPKLSGTSIGANFFNYNLLNVNLIVGQSYQNSFYLLGTLPNFYKPSTFDKYSDNAQGMAMYPNSALSLPRTGLAGKYQRSFSLQQPATLIDNHYYTPFKTFVNAPEILKLRNSIYEIYMNRFSFAGAAPAYNAAYNYFASYRGFQRLYNGTMAQGQAEYDKMMALRNQVSTSNFPFPYEDLYIPTETSPGVWQNVLRRFGYYNLPTRKFGIVRYFVMIKYDNFTGKNVDYSKVYSLNPATKMYFDTLAMPMYARVNYWQGRTQVRNGLLLADGFKDFNVSMVDFNEATADLMADTVINQASIEELIKDYMNGMFSGDTEASYYYENGIKYVLKDPTTGADTSVTKLFMDLVFESQSLFTKFSTSIDKQVEGHLANNQMALSSAQAAFERGVAISNGPAALAEYELKLNTGVFYLQNGISYWRKFTADEQKAFDIMKGEALKNKEIADKNAQTEELNRLALERVNAEVLQSNDQKIMLATAIIEVETEQELAAKASALVVPSIVQLIDRAIELDMNAPETLEQWIKEHPYIVLNPEKSAQAEALMKEVTVLEEKVATSMVIDTLNEGQFTRVLSELFTKV